MPFWIHASLPAWLQPSCDSTSCPGQLPAISVSSNFPITLIGFETLPAVISAASSVTDAVPRGAAVRSVVNVASLVHGSQSAANAPPMVESTLCAIDAFGSVAHSAYRSRALSPHSIQNTGSLG